MPIAPVTALAAFATGPVAADGPAMAVLRLSLLDWLACGFAGVSEPVARAVRRMIEAEGGQGQAALFGGGRAPARAAALLNGAASHALDYDDTHFAHIGHPSVAVLPAALAVAERESASGAAFQDAALIGVEASVRIGVWLGRSHYQAGFHQTATAGAFGAALAAARLMGADAEAMGHVLGLTATRAAGLKAQFGTMGKPYNAGLAAQAGVEAATLVACGIRSNPDAFTAFAETHKGGGGDLPETWLFPEVSHKYHACCHGLHASLEALATLLPVHEVDQIEIETHPRWMSVCNQPAPMTGLGAKFSYPTVAAMAVLGIDTARPESYTDALMQDPALSALRKRVQVTASASLSETSARVSVQSASGRHSAEHDLRTPVPPEARRARVTAKAVSLLGQDRTVRLSELIDRCAAPQEIGAALS